MIGCPFCSQLSQENIREAFEKSKPLFIERVEMVEAWHELDETHWRAVFRCDACAMDTAVVIELIQEPDPADWWKLTSKDKEPS